MVDLQQYRGIYNQNHCLQFIRINFVLYLFYIKHSYSGKAADIWALGATLYALLFGTVPFLATNVPAVYEKIKYEELQFPNTPAICADLKDLLEQMLKKDPTQRITLLEIKVSALLNFIII